MVFLFLVEILAAVTRQLVLQDCRDNVIGGFHNLGQELLPFLIPIPFLRHFYQQRQLAGILGLERPVKGSYRGEFLLA